MPEENEQTQSKEGHAGGSIVDTARANMSTEGAQKEIRRRDRERQADKEDHE